MEPSEVVRCRGCGYELTGLTGTVCPECGQAFARGELITPGTGEALERARRAMVGGTGPRRCVACGLEFEGQRCPRCGSKFGRKG